MRAGLEHTLELTLPELRDATHLRYSGDEAELGGCGVFVVTVPTPVDELKRPDLGALMAASQSIARAMKPGAVVIDESTVYLGCTEEVCVSLVEAVSGLPFNRDFYCGYSPLRIRATVRLDARGSQPGTSCGRVAGSCRARAVPSAGA